MSCVCIFLITLLVICNSRTRNTNLIVDSLSYLGDDTLQYDPSSITILPDQTIIIAAQGTYTPNNITPQTFLSSTTSSMGTLIILSLSTSTTMYSITGLAKIGASIDQICSNENTIIVVGAFGIISLEYNPTTKKFSENWKDISSTMGTNGNCKCDIGIDNTVVILLIGNSNNNNIISVYNNNGNVIWNKSDINLQGYNDYVLDVAIDTSNNLLFYTGWSQVATNLQTPSIFAYNYLNPSNNSYIYKLYNWWNSALTNAGDTSDAKLLTINYLNNKIYVLGTSNGGVSCFRHNPLNLTIIENNANIKDSTDGSNQYTRYTGNDSGPKLQWLGIFNSINGELIKGQFMQVRKTSDGNGNSLTPIAMSVDNIDNNLFITHNMACCIDKSDELSVNNISVGNYGNGDSALAIISDDLLTRQYWTRFTNESVNNGNNARDVIFKYGIMAYIGIVKIGVPIIEINPLSGTMQGNNIQSGFIVIKKYRNSSNIQSTQSDQTTQPQTTIEPQTTNNESGINYINFNFFNIVFYVAFFIFCVA